MNPNKTCLDIFIYFVNRIMALKLAISTSFSAILPFSHTSETSKKTGCVSLSFAELLMSLRFSLFLWRFHKLRLAIDDVHPVHWMQFSRKKCINHSFTPITPNRILLFTRIVWTTRNDVITNQCGFSRHHVTGANESIKPRAEHT